MVNTFPIKEVSLLQDKVLFVDDDVNILDGMNRQFRRHFNLSLANSGVGALKLIENEGPYAVIVSDRMMPGMNGIEFLNPARHVTPDSVRIMLTGDAHLEAAMDAVNEGQIYRFLTKPCSREVMRTTVERGVEQYRMITSQKVLLSQTLQGSIKVLVDMLGMVNPDLFVESGRMRSLVKEIAAEMNIPAGWEIEVATMLSQIGYVTIPPRIIHKIQRGDQLDVSEQDIYEKHPKTGYDLISNIPRLEKVAHIVLYQHKNYNGSGFPEDSCGGQDIPLGSRILKVVFDFENWSKRRVPTHSILSRMRSSKKYDSDVLNALEKYLGAQSTESDSSPDIQRVSLLELRSGMVVANDLTTLDGSILLVRKNQELSPVLLERIRNFSKQKPVMDVVEVIARQREASTAC